MPQARRAEVLAGRQRDRVRHPGWEGNGPPVGRPLVAGRDVQNSTGHADQRMVSYYDRNRTSLARNATHTLSAYVEGAM